MRSVVNHASRKGMVVTRGRFNRVVPLATKEAANPLAKLGQVLREKAKGDFGRIFKGTAKTRERLSVIEELMTYWNLDEAEDQLEELEDALISADFGPRTALKVVDGLREEILAGRLKPGEDVRIPVREGIISTLNSRGGRLKTGEGVRVALREGIISTLNSRGGKTELLLPSDAKPAVILVVGVNGGGKTTTIGKLAHQFTREGMRVMLGSGDTFRAAAFEQLKTWGERTGAAMGSYAEGKKPAQVLKQALREAVEQEKDILLCDTSGRLHTNWALMEELSKVERELGRVLIGAPHEVLLVLDGSTGLNMMNQAREFGDSVNVTGIILTKLDGSARGGAVVSVVDELGIPVKYVGVGEGLEDLQPFDCESFVNSLFPEGDTAARQPMEDVKL